MKSLEHIVVDILRHPEIQSDSKFIEFIQHNLNHIMTLLKLVQMMQRNDLNHTATATDAGQTEATLQLMPELMRNLMLIQQQTESHKDPALPIQTSVESSVSAQDPAPAKDTLSAEDPTLTQNPVPVNLEKDPMQSDPIQSESGVALVKNLRHHFKFQVQNARVNQAYQSAIKVINQDNIELIIKADGFNFPVDLGLAFDESLNMLVGTPSAAQDSEFSFLFSTKAEPEQLHTGHCKISIIADPRSLWQINEPAADAPFAKAHLHSETLEHPAFKILAASRRGRSHEHAGSFRDDDFAILNIADTDWSVLTVADGAGSAAYSRQGAKIAVDTVKEHFRDFLKPEKIVELDQLLDQWNVGSQDEHNNNLANQINQQFFQQYYHIYKSIIESIDTQAEQLNCHAKQFSTTLLIAVVKHQHDKTFLITFSVGDGAIAAYSSAQVRLMNVADSGEFAGQTKFLDKSIHHDFASRIKMGYFKAIEAVYLMTDGISDPYFETDHGLADPQKWHALHLSLAALQADSTIAIVDQETQPSIDHQLVAEIDAATVAKTDAERKLLEWMHFFKAGHHDDRSMIVLTDHVSDSSHSVGTA